MSLRERQELESDGANPGKKLGDVLMTEFESNVWALLNDQCPRDFSDTDSAACYLTRCKETAGRGYMKMLTCSVGPFVVYEMGTDKALVIDLRTAKGI